MNRHVSVVIGGAFLALMVPGCALALAADADHTRLGLAVAPFGWPRIVIVHLCSGLPLAVAIGMWIARYRSSIPRLGAASLVLGVLVALATCVGGAQVQSDLVSAGFGERFLVRVGWCLLLQLPWCVAGAYFAGIGWRIPFVPSSILFLTVATAVAPPLLFTNASINAWTRRATDALAEGRLVDARTTIAGLNDLGSSELIAGQPPRQILVGIKQQIQALEASVGLPLSHSASPADIVDRARRLAILCRYDEAAETLAPLTASDASALLLLGAIRQKQGQFTESDAAYGAALDQLDSVPGTEANQCRAYDGLAFNARAAGRPTEAEAAYEQGLRRIPSASAYFHFQLGRHYEQSGRPGRALDHLQAAIGLDPTRYSAAAQPIIDRLQRSTPGCLLTGPTGR